MSINDPGHIALQKPKTKPLILELWKIANRSKKITIMLYGFCIVINLINAITRFFGDNPSSGIIWLAISLIWCVSMWLQWKSLVRTYLDRNSYKLKKAYHIPANERVDI